jgi:hypothetical protein
MADTDQQPTPQTTGAVMDVQPPKSVDVAVESTPAVEPVATVEPSPAIESAPAAEEASSSTESTSEQPPAQNNPLAVPLDGTAHHKAKPLGVIIFALIVAGVLAGLTVYAFKNSQSSTTKPTASTQQAKTVETVTPADVDQASKDVDAEFQKIDDTKDLTASDLADSTLGL